MSASAVASPLLVLLAVASTALAAVLWQRHRATQREAFILHTRHYDSCCRRAFGSLLHHTPAEALGSKRRKDEGLRRCRWQACREENIHPRSPTRLPVPFALDAKLAIAGGFSDVPDCSRVRREDAGNDGACTAHCCGSGE